MSKETLQAIRKARGMTQKELAAAAGIKLKALQHYEGGFRDIDMAAARTVVRIAKALDVTVEDIIGPE